VQDKLMQESGADALMTMVLDLDVAQDGDFGVLIPRLRFALTGRPNETTSTRYYSAVITGQGIPSENIGLKVEYSSATGADMKGRNDVKVYHTPGKISAEELDKLLRGSDLVTVFTKALRELKAKEKANTDYEVVWNLKQ
jgi:hypothetical protein